MSTVEGKPTFKRPPSFYITRRYRSTKAMIECLNAAFGLGRFNASGSHLDILLDNDRWWFTSFRIHKFENGTCAITDDERI